MPIWSIVIAVAGLIITLGINGILFAYSTGRNKGQMEAMAARLVALEAGNGNNAGAQATMVEKVANIERLTGALPELQASLVKLSADFGASQSIQAEQRQNLREDYHAVLNALVARQESTPRPAARQRTTKQ